MRLLIAFGALLWALALGPALAAATAGLQKISVADSLVVNRPDRPEVLETQVPLPFYWDSRFFGDGGTAVLRFSLTADMTKDGVPALYFRVVGNGYRIYVDDELIDESIDPAGIQADTVKRPRMVLIPPKLMTPGTPHILQIAIGAAPMRRATLSAIVIGRQDLVRSLYLKEDAADWISVTLLSAAALLLGLLALSLWWFSRERFFLAFAFGALMWIPRISDSLFDTPILQWPAWGGLLLVTATAYNLNSAWLAREIMGQRFQWTLRLAVAAFPVLAALALVGIVWHDALAFQVWRGSLLFFGCLMTLSLLREVWIDTARQKRLFAAAMLVAIGGGMVDWVYNRFVGALYGAAPFSRLGFVLLAVFMAWYVGTRFTESLRSKQDANRHLQQEVADVTAQLSASYEYAKQAEHKAAIASERQRIMRDIHDGLGSRLIDVVGHLRQPMANTEMALLEAQLALDELRLTVDSMTGAVGDVGTVLGTLRHRLLKRFEGAGLLLHWQVDRLPQMASLTPATVRNLQLLMLECLSNIIQHARATEVTVRAYGEGETIVIAVTDNGIGFEPAATTGGRGMDSMRVRASQMRGSLVVTSAPGRGASMELRLPTREMSGGH